MNWKNILILVLSLLVIYFIWRNSTNKCYYLPKNSDPRVFGPFYWKAIHDLAERVPCGECRSGAISIMSGVHDLVNKKLGKPLYDKDNFDKFVKLVNQTK